jgi:hypothetical protein
MKTRLLALFSIMWLGICLADVPQGTYTYSFSAGSGGPLLWSLIGDYSGDSVSFSIDTQDGRGGLWSSNRFMGFVSGTLSSTRARLWLQQRTWQGDPYAPGSVRTDSFHFLNLKVDTNFFTLSGSDYFFEKQRGFFPFSFWFDSQKQSVIFPLPNGNDGSWSLELDLTANVDMLTGTATITYVNGTTATFNVRGRHSPITDMSQLLLFGTGQNRGSFLQLTLAGPGQALEFMRGRVSGQFLNSAFPGGG